MYPDTLSPSQTLSRFTLNYWRHTGESLGEPLPRLSILARVHTTLNATPTQLVFGRGAFLLVAFGADWFPRSRQDLAPYYVLPACHIDSWEDSNSLRKRTAHDRHNAHLLQGTRWYLRQPEGLFEADNPSTQCLPPFLAPAWACREPYHQSLLRTREHLVENRFSDNGDTPYSNFF